MAEDIPVYQNIMWFMAIVGIVGGIVLPLAGIFYIVHISLLAAAFDLIVFIQTHFVVWALVAVGYIVVRFISYLVDKTRENSDNAGPPLLEYGLFWLFSVSITYAIRRLST